MVWWWMTDGFRRSKDLYILKVKVDTNVTPRDPQQKTHPKWILVSFDNNQLGNKSNKNCKICLDFSLPFFRESFHPGWPNNVYFQDKTGASEQFYVESRGVWRPQPENEQKRKLAGGIISTSPWHWTRIPRLKDTRKKHLSVTWYFIHHMVGIFHAYDFIIPNDESPVC